MTPTIAELTDGLAQVKDAVAVALAEAKQQGVSAAECALSRSTGISVGTRMGDVETVEFNQDGALGISVYREHASGMQKGSASTTDLSTAAISAAVRKAVEIASHTSPDPFAGLAPSELMAQDYPELNLCHPADQSAEFALEQALACERAALAMDRRIVNSDGAGYSSHCGYRVYGNSHGFLGGYLQSRHSLSCSLIGQQDERMQRDYSYTVARQHADLWTPERVAQEAVSATVSRLGGKRVKTGNFPVIFRADVANSLFGHLVGAISGGNLYRKASFLLDKIDTEVLPTWLSIVEQPHLRGALASSPFDNEGVATQERTIIEQGVLRSYLLTSYAARKMQRVPTGHAGGIHNWQVQADTAHHVADLEALCEQMGTGLLVTELMGQGVNLVNGDYSRGAAGFWIENGKIKHPVEEITIAGNLSEMFSKISAVAGDVDQRHGVLTGSVLVDGMKVAGE